ncbi:hypothetical protein KM043_006278 [Ampulex compressa]|nr:hypothetical protein KM043_006278 [Ampulex compressa]
MAKTRSTSFTTTFTATRANKRDERFYIRTDAGNRAREPVLGKALDSLPPLPLPSDHSPKTPLSTLSPRAQFTHLAALSGEERSLTLASRLTCKRPDTQFAVCQCSIQRISTER